MAGCLEGRAVKRTGPRRTALPRKVVSAEQDHDLEVDTTKYIRHFTTRPATAERLYFTETEGARDIGRYYELHICSASDGERERELCVQGRLKSV
jgi:hypothetical protein